MYKFEYMLDDGDYLEFNKFHHFSSQAFKRNLLVARYGVPAICAMFIFYAGMGMGGLVFWAAAVVFGAGGLIWLFGFERLIFNPTLKRQIKNLRKEGKMPYDELQTITFGEENFHKTTPSGEMTLNYDSFDKIAEGEAAVYIYLSTLQAIIMPLRIFESPAQRQEFLNFLGSKR
ncbi:MAG: YcxB family protein [Clostridiales bacterium]|nr:YcxB family protein [Clostridiales bacterium]